MKYLNLQHDTYWDKGLKIKQENGIAKLVRRVDPLSEEKKAELLDEETKANCYLILWTKGTFQHRVTHLL